MNKVRAKKHLGQHFLKDENIAKKIADSLTQSQAKVLEIGPGMGVLSKYLVQNPNIADLRLVEIDSESVSYLEDQYPEFRGKIHKEDFLKMNLAEIFSGKFAIIGNFPYNISSQILFKVFDNRDKVQELVGMFQKEVAERVASKPGNKTYGILSVFLQAFYDIEYLFTVIENVFQPPPKVKSGVIRMKRNSVEKLDCNEKLFITIVKTSFNQRRKMLRSSLKPLNLNLSLLDKAVLEKRPETLTVDQFVEITQILDKT